jgi:AcrR family transcriptional regulator
VKKDDLSKGEKTKQAILDAGVKLWPKVTAREISRRLDITHPTINYHFPGDELQDAVAAHAVKTGNSRVIAQLIATKHRAVRKLTVIERQKHMDAAN